MSISKANFLFFAVLLGTFVVSLINTSMTMRNQQLISDIDKFTEEKMLIRANYFSRISANNLAFEANERSMIQPVERDVRRVLAPKQANLLEQMGASFNRFVASVDQAMRSPADIISGY